MSKKISTFVAVLDNIRSAHNVGSIFRTADAAGIDALLLCGITPAPGSQYSRSGVDRVSKVALGAEKNVKWTRCTQTWRAIGELKDKGFFVAALEVGARSVDYLKFKPQFPLALILGNEVNGLSKKILKRCDGVIKLPMRGKKESLNVAVAFGIAAYKINESRVRSRES